MDCGVLQARILSTPFPEHHGVRVNGIRHQNV